MYPITFLFPEYLSNIKDFDRVEIHGYQTAGDENSPAVFFREIMCSGLDSSFEVDQDLCESIEQFKFMFYRNQRRFHTFSSDTEHLHGYSTYASTTGKYTLKKRYHHTMKILIPEKFKKEQELISSLDLEILHKDDSESNFSKNIPLDHISAFEFTEIKNSAYHKCDTVQYRVKFKNGTTEIFKFNHKQNALYRSKLNASAQHCVRHKLSELFEDTDEGRLDCLEELDNKILEASGLSKQSRGTKNLVYYTIYFNKGYIELLDKSITSIINKSKTTFDVLLITDEPTRELILQQPFVSKIAPKFLITETPFDGIEASQNKARVFEYEHIHEYDKVLFLDCDIVCLQDINKILNQDLDTNTLYTARNLNLNHSFHTSFHHGFEFLDQDHVEEMKIAKQWPFNAGQFLFRTSDRMQKHFENINWFMKHWAGEYFFEQAFMCYYFCKAYLTDDSILQQHMSIVSTINESQYNITNDTCLVHFIAPPLDAATKLSFINNFMKQHQLQSEQNNRFHIKISKLFAGLIKQFKQRFV